jgi:hypothetical protein
LISAKWLSYALHPAACEKRYFLMLTAYMDESGHSVDPRCNFVGMGGLVATTEKWEAFSEAWKSALDEFIDGKPFHMKEYVCKPGIGPYVGWHEDKRKAFLARLIEAIAISKARLIGCVVSNEGYNKLQPAQQNQFLDPYFLCFQQVTHGCRITGMTLTEELWSGEPVAMVYAYQQTFGAVDSGSTNARNQGKAEQLWHAMKAQPGPFGKFMGAYASSLAKDFFPLQAADLFAYELTKEFENRVSRPNDNMRWALKQLLSTVDEDALLQFYSHEAMLEILMDDGHVPENVDLRLASIMRQLDVKIDMQGRVKK